MCCKVLRSLGVVLDRLGNIFWSSRGGGPERGAGANPAKRPPKAGRRANRRGRPKGRPRGDKASEEAQKQPMRRRRGRAERSTAEAKMPKQIPKTNQLKVQIQMNLCQLKMMKFYAKAVSH